MSTVDVGSQCNCVCTCGGKVKLVKAEQDRRLIHFLMGLNEMYTAIRGHILMMSILPNMAQAFAILSQEKKQREVKPHNHTALDSTSLNAFASTYNSAGTKGGPRTTYNSSRESAGTTGNSNNTNVFRGNSSTSRTSLFCDLCRRTCHTKDRCYKLHGYPPNFKFSKGKNVVFAANACTSESDGSRCEGDHGLNRKMPLNLSKNQYEQLLNLLGSLQVGHGTTNNSKNMLSGAMNLAESAFCAQFQGPSLKSPLELGRAKNGLYFLCSKCHNCCPSPIGTRTSHASSSHCHTIPSLVKCNHVSAPSIVKQSFSVNKDVCSSFDSPCHITDCSSFVVKSDNSHGD
ncbi:hypothetical protein KY289_023349 [Solanum tuberosum]|nr:hypothetical protein KY289_023349 [Solanum tuberosum]